MIDRIDGGLFGRMVVQGAATITVEKQAINELNVFPVPDGDTGTNMCLSIGAAATELQKKPTTHLGDATHICAGALLRGARGNSGVILSLLFRGFSKSAKELETMDGRDFAIALDSGVAAAYKAVMKPAEGTILTVSRLTAAAAAHHARENNAIEYVIEQALVEGHVALENTVNQNPVLKKAGVVDAGGLGFLYILQGMLDCIQGKEMPSGTVEAAPVVERVTATSASQEEILFGYCTEFICSRDTKKDPEALRGFLSALGDSLVLVDDDEIIKVHVHTNHPGKVLEEAITYGALLTVKIENMREQHSALVAEEAAAQSAPEPQEEEHTIAPPEKKYGIVAVAAGDGLAEILRDLGADGVISGGQTMNPSTADIMKQIDQTPAEVVFVLPNNSNIIMAAQQCVPLGEAQGKEIIILPTKTVPQAIAALLVMDLDASPEENLATMSEAMAAVTTSEITYAARDSDFDGFAITCGDYLALSKGQLFGTDKTIEALIEKLALDQPQQDAEFINIFYGADVTEEEAQKALDQFTALCPKAEITLLPGGQPVYYYMISAE